MATVPGYVASDRCTGISGSDRYLSAAKVRVAEADTSPETSPYKASHDGSGWKCLNLSSRESSFAFIN